ncbi:MAG TPA: heme-binding domain-containing protein [Oligoflexus sp.]|uniref:heme-binding domain-containing protein n=1 Tax=Oligoflexus sp. TaxID=1971216 RepID=UPI002D7F4077|nr:heme-binding domain-containing protein [Oligoflexus sp.]HET9237492.1 heme-binding domain-containing protein [Oligoflexus sp.]
MDHVGNERVDALRLMELHTVKAFLGFLLLIDLNPSTAYAHKSHIHAKPGPGLNDEKEPVKEAGIEADAVFSPIGACRGFPFKGHGSVSEDLTAIEEVVRDGSMPPVRYRVLHPGSSLTGVERERVTNWVEDSLKLLKE